MIKKLMQLIFIPLTSFGIANATIVESNSTANVLDVANAKSLVLFNITDTLYVSSNTLGTAEWREYLVENVNGWIADPTEAQNVIIKMKRATMLAMPKRLVEETTPSVIASLQKQQIPVLGFTQKDRSTPWIPNFDEVVKDHLVGLGINFEATNAYFAGPSSEDSKLPYYMYGIIFTEGKPRTESIKAFLHHLPVKVDRVILLDDRMTNLTVVEAALQAEGIEFFGFRYNQTDELKAKMDPILGIIQLEQFWTNGAVMSDEDAQKIKDANPGYDYEALLKSLVDKYKS